MTKPVALVTGAGSGIGRGIAQTLAASGWRVAVNDVDADLARCAADELGGIAVPGDVTEVPAQIVADVLNQASRLDVLVNNAGALRSAPLADITADELDSTYRLNLRAPILLAQSALPFLAKAKGSIINISSISVL